jgi:2-succinyl-6-hydroxy-2,4-cyclohexadiene-1-carboxylate synthase
VASRPDAPPAIDLGGGFAGRILGDGERVMWLHGYTLDSTVWTDLWAQLRGWGHVGVDLPGHGGSAAVPGLTLPELAGRLAALAREQGVRHVVAMSFGTFAGLELALRGEPWLRSVTLAGPAIAGGPAEAAAAERYEELMDLHAREGPGPHLRELWMRSPPDIFLEASRRPQLWDRLTGVVGAHRWSELGDGGMRAVDLHVQPPEALRRIRTRMLVLVGEHELAAHLRCAAILRATVPGCRVLQVPAAGHLPLLEEPAASATAIRPHLLGPPGGQRHGSALEPPMHQNAKQARRAGLRSPELP